ncbi:MAG TPA: lytic transglycosylase domain-containing protein [Polyangiales bacterium]|nr:lytic transglycosylase domain-containing protein [Polyangiales bacterium]
MASPDLNPSSLRARAKNWLYRQLRLGIGLGALVILTINGGVRASGGHVNLLSVDRLGEKAKALGMSATHRLTCWFHGDEDVEAEIRKAALKHGVPVKLALSVARAESSFRHMVISHTGAMGVMQLMPGTARELGVSDPFSIEHNVDGGVRYLKQLLTHYRGNVKRTLAAYNAGPGRISKSGAVNMPAETKGYVARIISKM